jgi:hypothetical protein
MDTSEERQKFKSPLIDYKDDLEINNKKKKSYKKINPKENVEDSDDDIRIINIFNPETGDYVKKIIKKV